MLFATHYERRGNLSYYNRYIIADHKFRAICGSIKYFVYTPITIKFIKPFKINLPYKHI